MTDKNDALSSLVTWYEASDTATYEARQLAERDRDYYDNKQWTANEVNTLKERGQPAVTINRIKPKIDFLLGTERTNRTDPRAFPRTPMDDEAAKAASDAIVYVCDDQDFSQKRSDVAENIWIEGIGGVIVEMGENRKIIIRRIPWDRIFYDPHSRERDFSDAKYIGIVAWMDQDEAESIYKGAGDLVSASLDFETSQTYDDKPRNIWVDRNRKRVKFCEVYYRKNGVWMHCVYTRAGIVVGPEQSPYLEYDGEDEEGRPSNPVVLGSCYVDRENARYGVVRQLVGPQDEINKRRSKALHLISVRQVLAEKGAVDSIPKAKRELAKPDGWVEYNPSTKVEIAQTGDMALAQFQLLQEAKNEIDAVGANSALTGKQEQKESGRAIQARQQGGLIELGPVLDAIRQWQRSVYKQIWYRVKQYWDAEKWIRITDDEKNVRFVGLNQPLTAGEQIVMQAKAQGATPEQLQALVEQIKADPSMQQVVGIQNDVSKMDVDIILEDVPDTVSIQQEEFQLLTEAYRANPQTPVNPMGIPFDVVIEASNLRNKQKLLERMRGGQVQGPQALPQGIPQGIPQEAQVDPVQVLQQATQEAAQQLTALAEQAVQTIQQQSQAVQQQMEAFSGQVTSLMREMNTLNTAQALAGLQQGMVALGTPPQ